ncbi:MAG TPA: hypothetical protein VLB27_10055 [candidate division Zixibacteria bacterium]|nr:hypothetical protein [candidate division Zixibacteria bacterium]
MNVTQITKFPTVIQRLGSAANAWLTNKYGRAAREIAALDLTPPALTGPPHRAQGLQRGFIDLLV